MQGPVTENVGLSAVRLAGVPLPRAPRLAPWITVVDLGDGRMQLRAAEYVHTLTLPLFCRAFAEVKDLLDGTHTVEEIVSAVGSDIMPSTVVFLLKILQANGALQEGASSAPPSSSDAARWNDQLMFLSHFTPDPWSAQQDLLKARVAITGESPRRHVRDALEAVGITDIVELAIAPSDGRRLVEQLAGVELVIACSPATDASVFDSVNSACLETRTRWMHVATRGTTSVLGPTVVPYQTACYACYDARALAHVEDVDAFAAYRSEAATRAIGEGTFDPLSAVVGGHVAAEVSRILTGFAPPVTIGRCWELSARSIAAVAHDVLRLPRCRSCGTSVPRPEPWDLAVPDDGPAPAGRPDGANGR